MSAPPSKQRVRITGASGYLGQFLVEALCEDATIELVAAYGALPSFPAEFGAKCACVERLDLAERDAAEALVKRHRPDALVHLAAVSSPAACQSDPARAFQINSPLPLLEALPDKCNVIFLSTDQAHKTVFSARICDVLYISPAQSPPRCTRAHHRHTRRLRRCFL